MRRHVGARVSATLAVPGVIARTILAAALLCLVALSTGCASTGDVELVYCLAPEQQARIVAAADVLDLAEPGGLPGTVRVGSTDLGLEDWHRHDIEAFNRACRAIRPASTGGSALATTASSTINFLLGVLLTLGATYLTGRLARGQQAADALREAAQRLARWIDAAEGFRTRRTREEPSETALFDRLSALDAALWRARSYLRDGDAVASLLRQLDVLTGLLTRPWQADAAADELTTVVHGLQNGVEEVAAALDRPLRRRRRASTAADRSSTG